MSHVDSVSRPVSNCSNRLPSQAGVKAAFSRPVTGQNDILPDDFEDQDYEGDIVDQVLITQLHDQLDEHPDFPNFDIIKCEEKRAKAKTPDIFNAAEWDTDLESDEEEEVLDPNFKQFYLDMCQRLGVVPTSFFVRHIEDPTIDMKHHGISGSEAKAIAEALKKILKVEKLNLESNCIDERGCKYLCNMLDNNKTLKSLSLSGNCLGNRCAADITGMLGVNGTLQNLSLANNQFDDNVAPLFAECLEDCKLNCLDLSKNKFSDRGGKILGPAIGANVYMDKLDLSWNQLRLTGAISVAKGLKENVRLTVCDLSWNGFGEDGGLAIADALISNTSIKEIDLSSNRLTLPVAHRLAKALLVNEVLEVLKLARNPITTAGCLTLVEALNKTTKSLLNHLDLYENPVDVEFLQAAKQVEKKKLGFTLRHGPILRAGNTQEDIGKPAVDVSRLSRKPVMILNGQLTVNDKKMFDNLVTKFKIKNKSCSTEELLEIIKKMDGTLTQQSIEVAISKLPKTDTGQVLFLDLF